MLPQPTHHVASIENEEHANQMKLLPALPAFLVFSPAKA